MVLLNGYGYHFIFSEKCHRSPSRHIQGFQNNFLSGEGARLSYLFIDLSKYLKIYFDLHFSYFSLGSFIKIYTLGVINCTEKILRVVCQLS